MDIPASKTTTSGRGQSSCPGTGRPKISEQTFADPRVDQIIWRNVMAYKQRGSDRVPVLIRPNAKPIEGRIEDAQVIVDFLEGDGDGNE